MTSTPKADVKVAISYSWTSPEHKEWVRQLGARLRDVEIDVVLDVWDFNFGDDTIVYMERFVNDATISKLLLVCDRAYMKKANAREGGVGIESQIISPDVYKSVTHSRFIPVVTEFDENGEAYLPTYLRGRWYADLSSAETFEERFAELVAHIYSVPLNKKPPLGKRPRYLDEEDTALATVFKARALIDAVRNERRTIPGLTEDYLDVLGEVLKGEELAPFDRRLHPQDAADLVYIKVVPFLPYKSEFLEVLTTACKYGATQNLNVLDAVHNFFRSLVPLMYPLDSLDHRYNADRFVVYELFVTCIGVLLKYGRFDDAGYLLEQEYRVSNARHQYGPDYYGLNNFNVFSPVMRSFEVVASSRREFSQLSLEGQLLFDRSKEDARLLDREDIMNADVTLYCRGLSTSLPQFRWTCKTAGGRYGVPASPLFSKAASKSFFDRFKRVLNVNSPDAFRDLIADLYEKRRLSGFTLYTNNDMSAHQQLLGLDELGSR